MDTNLLFLLFVAALVGASSGYLGSFMVLKRMSLVGDALSHVALPGLAIALTLGINPMIGALTILLFAVLGIWFLGEKTDVYSETLVGIFFTASLAIGILLTPEPELLEALFGNIETITLFDKIATIVFSLIIFLTIYPISNKLILGIVSEDLAKSSGTKIAKVNLLYLLAVGLVVGIGVKFVGTLLTGALVIIPAATAKNIAKSIKGFQILSVLFGILSTAGGILLAQAVAVPTGPLVVLTAVFLFAISFLFKKH